MAQWLKRYWPPLVATSFLWTACAICLVTSLKWNSGHVVYALDDTYIHMALAKHVARNGVWGVTPFAFTFSSSSPLWTSLLAACDLVFGVNDVAPLVLNILFGTLLVFALARLLEQIEPSLPRACVLGVLLAVLFLAPLPSLIFVGMEHTLHALLTLLLVYSAAMILSHHDSSAAASSWRLVVLAVLTSLTRYEGVLAIGVIGLALLLEKRWRLAAVMGTCALLPHLVLGLMSVQHGWFALPNSVLLKGNLPPEGAHSLVASFLAHLGESVTGTGLRVVRLMGAVLLFALYRFKKGKGSADPWQWVAGIFVAMAALHLVFARAGWFYRYEAYLMVLGLATIAPTLFEFLRQFSRNLRLSMGEAAGLVALAVLAATGPTFWKAGYRALRDTPLATHNIYDCNYQLGIFISHYYSGMPLALNDLGAADYLADIQVTDFHGLADMAVARALLKGEFNPQVMEALVRSRGVQVAIVDDNWLGLYGGTPRQWLLAGRWRFGRRVTLAYPEICFYALTPGARDRLMAILKDFSSQLPSDVEQLGPYTETANTSPVANGAKAGLPHGTIHVSQ